MKPRDFAQFYWISVIVAFLFISCGSSEREQRFKEFTRYLNEGLRMDLPSSGLYFVIQPSCFDCARRILDMVADIECSELKIVCLGTITQENAQDMVTLAKGKEVIFDRANIAARYELGIEKAMFIHFQDNVPLRYASFGYYTKSVVEYANDNCGMQGSESN